MKRKEQNRAIFVVALKSALQGRQQKGVKFSKALEDERGSNSSKANDACNLRLKLLQDRDKLLRGFFRLGVAIVGCDTVVNNIVPDYDVSLSLEAAVPQEPLEIYAFTSAVWI